MRSSNSIKQKSPDNAGALVCGVIMRIRSVPAGATITITAKFVADAASDHADIRPGVGGEGADCEVRRQERAAVTLSEEIVVFDAGSPIRRETILKAHTDYSAPTGPLCLPKADAGEGIEDVEALACDGGAALHINQGCIPGVADLTREEAQAIDVGFPGVSSVQQRGIHKNTLGPEISPVALSFQSKHPGARLPAVTDLATDNATTLIIASFSEYVKEPKLGDIEALPGPAIAAVRADVKAGPVVNRCHIRERRLIRPSREICRRCGGSDAQRNERNGTKQELLHHPTPLSCASLQRTITARAPIEIRRTL